MRGQKFFEFTRTWFLSCSNKGIFDELQILAAFSRAQRQNNSEYTEYQIALSFYESIFKKKE